MQSECVHAMFRTHALRQPGLVAAGARRDVLIGLHARGGFEMIIGMLGILKAGVCRQTHGDIASGSTGR